MQGAFGKPPSDQGKITMTDLAIDGLDHSIIGVRDLEQARATYEKLGFTITRRGRHIGWGTANYCVMFGPDYLEILGIVDPSQFDAGLNDFIKHREGLLKIASRSSEMEVTAQHLADSGFDPAPVQDLARLLEMPEGDVKPAFKLTHLPAEKTPGLSTFFCQHLTPDLVWRKEWLEHANGAKTVYAYTILHYDPAALAGTYEKMFGHPACQQEGRLIVETGGGKLVFCDPEYLDQLHPGLNWAGPKEDGTMVAATITVGETAVTAAVLEKNGVPFERREDGSILVQPDQAHGMGICFQAL